MPTRFDLTSTSLLRAARDPGNQAAWEAFAKCYEGLIRDWCRRQGLQPADQDDLTQKILLKLSAMLPEFEYEPSKSFRGLLFRIVQNAIADFYRERKRLVVRGSGDTDVLDNLREAPAPDDSSVEDLVQAVAGPMEHAQKARAACEAIQRRVKPHTWQAFWLTTVGGELTAEVAKRLGMTQGAVLVARHRVTTMIRSEVEGEAG